MVSRTASRRIPEVEPRIDYVQCDGLVVMKMEALPGGILQQYGGCPRRSSRPGCTESSGDHQLFSVSQERRNYGRGGVSARYDAKTEMVSVDVNI